MADQDTPPPIITAMKIPIIKKGEYDIWSMRIRQYICHTDHNLWDIIVNRDMKDEATPSGEQSSPPIPKTTKQLAARRNQERIKSILLLAIPDEYLLKFHNVPDAKSLWAAIKSRFRGNEESKKMQQNVQKHQFENFEDINQKFLRSLPPSWSQIALIMRNKPDIDDLYNNLRVYEDELKRSSGSNSASQNLAFLSSKNTNSTNEVSTASGDFGVSTAGGINQVPSTPSAHDIAYSFLAQPTTSPQLENEDFQQMDGDDLEELDLRWQVAMLTVRVKKKGHFARECRSGRSQGRRPYGDNGRSNAQTTESSSQALVAQDGLGGYDWSNDFEVEPVNYALMAISSSNSSSSSDSEVQKCSKCLESFKCLQKNYDTEREKHNKAKLEIRGYEIALESLEARILGHEKNELAWGERYEFQNYDLKCREIKINNLNLELEKVVKERDELKLKIEKWEGSSKNLTKILNSQMSTHDKNRLGFGTQMDDLSNKSETDSENSLIVFEVRSSDEESTLANNRFTKANKYHAVPPPIIGNPLTPRADISFAGLDEYAFRNKIIESKITKTNKSVGNTNEATIVKPKSVNETVVSKSKNNRDEVIIEDWTSDDEDDVCVVKTVSSVKPNVTQAVRSQADKSGQTSQKQGIGLRKPKDLKPDVKTFGVKNMTTVGTRAVVSKGKVENVIKKAKWGNPEILLQDHAVVDSGCSSHMTGNKAYLSDYEDLNGGFVAFGSDPKGGKITGKGKIKTANLDFDDVYFVDELKFNLFSVSQMCDKKNSVLFTESECLILSPSFKLLDESQVVLRAPRKDGVYSLDLKNIVPSGGITCLYANATADESKLWHRRLGHVNFKNINKLVKGHLVRGLPSKVFVNDHTCVACKKGKQHKASCKAKLDRIIRKPLELLHMDLFGPVSIESINKKRQAFEEEKRRIASQKKAAQATSTNQLSTDRPFVSTDRSFVSTDRSNTPNVKYASTSTEDASDTLPNDGIFNGAYDDDEDVGAVADFNNMDNTIAVSPIPTLKLLILEAIRLFLAFATYMGFLVYQMDVKSAFLYDTIEEEVYVHQTPGFVDPAQPNKVYKVVKALYGIHQAPRAWSWRHSLSFPAGECWTFLKKLIFASIKTATTLIESNKPLVKDEDGVEVDVHEYQSMIGSLMYLTASRPAIMFAVCACARKQTIVANYTTEAEYVAAAHCCGQVLWIQNQLMDYGFNFMNTKIYIDNESTKKSTDFVTPTKASREAQEEEISPTILEATKTLSKVASQGVSKEKSTDKGKRYRRRARSVAKNINIGLDAEEEINTGVKDVNTGSTKVDSGTASKRGQREGKALMIEEDIHATPN
ncbi:putative ribonuclease H-like domain-containing protein [Tanacetum coccineum]